MFGIAELRQSGKAAILEIVWHVLRTAALYGLGFTAVFLAFAYDNGWFEELGRRMQSAVGLSSSPVFCVLYVLGGALAGLYIGATKAIEEKTERVAEVIGNVGRLLAGRMAEKINLEQESIPLAELQRFFKGESGSEDTSRLPETLQQLKPHLAVLKRLGGRSMRPVRALAESVLKDYEMRGEREVSTRNFLETALQKLPGVVTSEMRAKWRFGRYVAYAAAAVWFAVPVALMYLLRG